MKLIYGTFETGKFTFSALGITESQADNILREGYELHCKHFPTAKPYEYYSKHFTVMHTRQCYRDGELMIAGSAASIALQNGCTAFDKEDSDFIFVRSPDGSTHKADDMSTEFFKSLTPHEVAEFDRLWRYDASPEQ